MNNKKTRQWQTAAGEGGVRVRGNVEVAAIEHHLQQQQIRPILPSVRIFTSIATA